MSAKDYPRQARQLLRAAAKASLATLDRVSGVPYASLVGIASLGDATPIVLVSTLARHTQNVAADPRASILVETTGATGDGLADGRATIMGRLVATGGEDARRRYLARHPGAAGYADFDDFGFYLLQVEEVHIVQGFGRIATMPGADFLLAPQTAATISALEQGAIDHMNDDHVDAVALYATRLCNGEPGSWRMVGIDAEGIDLRCADALARLDFPHPVGDAATLRATLAQLAAQARSYPAGKASST